MQRQATWRVQRDVDVIVLNVHRNAINRNLSRYFFPPSRKHYIVVNFSCTKPNLKPNTRTKKWDYSHMHRHSGTCTHRRKTDNKARPKPDCSIQHRHTLTTSAFHVLFKIMRSSSLLLTEEEWLFLPLNRHMSHTEECYDRGRKEMKHRMKTKND